jgi:allantoate deiminase
MNLRKDALAGMAEWAVAVEREALAIPGLVATVGRFEARPGAGNVIAGSVLASLDVRHADDAIRRVAVEQLVACARQITSRRGLSLSVEKLLDQPAVAMDPAITNILARAVESCGAVAQRMNSGAGHDAMIVARRMPSAMLFLRSPGGISHDPAETVQVADVAAALNAGAFFLQAMESRFG